MAYPSSNDGLMIAVCVRSPLSADRENDGGDLLVHRIVFRYPIPFAPASAADSKATPSTAVDAKQQTAATEAASSSSGYTVTELCHFPASCSAEDGPYLLNLSIAPIAMDAAPSRPVLFKAELQQAASASGAGSHAAAASK